MSERTDSVIKGLNLLAKHHDRPYSEWGNKAATAAIAEIDLLSEEIARLRAAINVIDECFAEMRTRLEEHCQPLPVIVKEVGSG